MEASRFFGVPFDKIAEEHLHKLKADEVSEGYWFEFKRDFPQGGVGKSVAAFANTHGGYLLIGVEAGKVRNVITDIPGIPVEEGLSEKVKNQVLASVNPMPLFRPKVVPLSDPRRCVLLVEVPESGNPPHFNKDGRIYVRTPTGSDPIPESNRYEVEKLFGKARDSRQLVEEAILAKLTGSRPTKAGWWGLGIVVCPSVQDTSLLGEVFTRAGYDRWANAAAQSLPEGGFNRVMTHEGLRVYCPNRDSMQSMVEITQGGLLHSLRHFAPYTHPELPNISLIHETRVSEALEKLLRLAGQVYEETGYFGTIRLSVLLSNVGGARLVRDSDKHMFPSDWSERPAAEQGEFKVDREISSEQILDGESHGSIVLGIAKEIRRCFHLEAFDDE